MHSYDHGRRERKKKKTFGPGMKKKKKEKMNDQSCTYKGHLHTKQRNLEWCGGQIGLS